MSRSLFCVFVFTLTLTLSLMPPPASADVTKTYRNGLDGYEGNLAANISSLGLSETGSGMNGTTFTDGVDWCIGDLPKTLGYDISPLMRFEGIEGVAGHELATATLRLRVTWWESGTPRLVVRYLAVPWSTHGADVGWRTREAGVLWDELGAEGEGTDVIASAMAMSEPLPATGKQTIDVALDPTIVSAWLADPAQNHGVVLRVDLPNHHVGVVPPMASDTEMRPTLILTFVPAGTVLPETDGGVGGEPEPSGGCAVQPTASSSIVPFALGLAVLYGRSRRRTRAC